MESKRFAVLPKRMTSGRIVWLNYYYQHRELYDTTTGRPPMNGLYFEWTETSAERTWRMLKETAVHNRNIWNDPSLTQQDKI
jgi:hypothetical protein